MKRYLITKCDPQAVADRLTALGFVATTQNGFYLVTNAGPDEVSYHVAILYPFGSL